MSALTESKLKELFGGFDELNDTLARTLPSMLITENGCGATYIGSGNGGHYIVSARHCGAQTKMKIAGTDIIINVEPIFEEQLKEHWYNGRDIQLYKIPESELDHALAVMEPATISESPETGEMIMITAPTFMEAETQTVALTGSPQDTDAFLTHPAQQSQTHDFPFPNITTEFEDTDYTRARGGYSGSPWLNEHGLVGIHSYGATRQGKSGKTYQSLTGASAEALKAMLQGLGIRNYGGNSFSEGTEGNTITDPDLAKRVQKAQDAYR